MQNGLIYGVDPGTTETGWVLWDGKRVHECGIDPNATFLERLRGHASPDAPPVPMFIEMIACYGMAVGRETFETVLWIGRFVEVWSVLELPWHLCYRVKVKTHHCHSAKATDANINQAIRDKYGDVGTKKKPGPLYGVKKHIWSALAIATYAKETKIKPSCRIEKEALPQ